MIREWCVYLTRQDKKILACLVNQNEGRGYMIIACKYIWEVNSKEGGVLFKLIGQWWQEKNVYKLSVTTFRLGIKR